MDNLNIGTFLYKICEGLIHITKSLYDVFTTEISMAWLNKLLSFYNIDLAIPNSISLMWILTSASGVVILGFMIYNIFKI